MQKTILLYLIHSQLVCLAKCERCKFINNCIRLSKAESEYICHVISTTLKVVLIIESFIIKQLVDNKKLMKININHKTKIMNLKRIFGALLTALGIGSYLYGYICWNIR
jgi:hypothetical protein